MAMVLMLDTLIPTEPTTLASVLLMLSPKLKHSTMVHMDLVSNFIIFLIVVSSSNQRMGCDLYIVSNGPPILLIFYLI